MTSVYTAGGTIAFMVCGANSDLFGRRYFILFGNILVFVGCVVGATSHHINQSIAAHTLIGFGAGNCQLAAFALPELLPNKWRHFAVVIADGLIYLDVIVGPVTSRVAWANGSVSTLDTVDVIRLTFVVAMGLLGARNLHWHHLCSIDVLLSPSEAPKRHPMGPSREKSRLRWNCELYGGCSDDSLRDRIRPASAVQLANRHRTIGRWLCMPDLLRPVGDLHGS